MCRLMPCSVSLPEFLNLIGMSQKLSLILGLPGSGITVSLGQLSFQFKSGLRFLFQLHLERLKLNLKSVSVILKAGSFLKCWYNDRLSQVLSDICTFRINLRAPHPPIGGECPRAAGQSVP